MGQVLQKVPDFLPFVMFKAAIQRDMGNFAEAEKLCFEQLRNNAESAYVYCVLARIQLKKFDDQKVMEYILKAYDIALNDLSVIVDLGLVDYYCNKTDELSDVLKKIENHPHRDSYKTEIDKLKAVISGQTKWR